MTLTEEQIQAIIDDAVLKLQTAIDDMYEGDYSDFEYYEDEEGHCYDFGSHTCKGTLEEICLDTLPGINKDESDISITADYCLDIDFHDDYDPGDYWTPPAGGIEIDKVEAYITEIDIDIEILNPQSGEYESIEIPESLVTRIIKDANEKVGLKSKSNVA